MDPHKNRIGNCESCLKMPFLVQIPEKCENANSNAKSFKNAKKMRAFLVKAYLSDGSTIWAAPGGMRGVAVADLPLRTASCWAGSNGRPDASYV